MPTPDMKRRPLTGISRRKQAVGDNIRNGHPGDMSSNRSSLLERLIDFDVRLTSKLGLCANANSTLGFLRPVLILLEWSCHGVPWIAGAVVAVLVSHDRSLLQIFLNLLVAMFVDLLVVIMLKSTFRRKRPAHNLDDMLVVDAVALNIDRHSFPSGHATRAVMTALFIVDKFDCTGGIKSLVYIWMVAVPLSRILLGRHHVFDVTVGVICGVLEYFAVVNYLWMSKQTCMDILQPIHEDLHL